MKFATTAVLAALITLCSNADADVAPLKVDQTHIKDYWERSGQSGKAVPLVSRDMGNSGASGCVAAAFTIDANGKTSEASVLRSYVTKKDGDEMRAHFEKNVLANVATWLYSAAASNTAHASIRTYVTVTVSASLGLNAKKFEDEVAAHCAVTDFAAP